jgi:hypothetical protein
VGPDRLADLATTEGPITDAIGDLMSIRAIKVNGRKVWQARVAFKGSRKSTIRPLA